MPQTSQDSDCGTSEKRTPGPEVKPETKLLLEVAAEEQSVYNEDIWKNLLEQESQKPPIHLQSPQLEFRGTLVQQLRDATCKLGLNLCTLHAAVAQLDLFMDAHLLRADRLTHVAMACLSLAAKSEEKFNQAPTLKMLSKISGLPLCGKTFRQLEWMVGQHLRWRLLAPTPVTFAALIAHCVVDDSDLTCRHPDFVRKFKHDGARLLEAYLDLTLSDVRLKVVETVDVGCACVACARADLGLCAWPPWLVLLTTRKPVSVAPIARLLQKMMKTMKARVGTDQIPTTAGPSTSHQLLPMDRMVQLMEGGSGTDQVPSTAGPSTLHQKQHLQMDRMEPMMVTRFPSTACASTSQSQQPLHRTMQMMHERDGADQIPTSVNYSPSTSHHQQHLRRMVHLNAHDGCDQMPSTAATRSCPQPHFHVTMHMHTMHMKARDGPYQIPPSVNHYQPDLHMMMHMKARDGSDQIASSADPSPSTSHYQQHLHMMQMKARDGTDLITSSAGPSTSHYQPHMHTMMQIKTRDGSDQISSSACASTSQSQQPLHRRMQMLQARDETDQNLFSTSQQQPIASTNYHEDAEEADLRDRYSVLDLSDAPPRAPDVSNCFTLPTAVDVAMQRVNNPADYRYCRASRLLEASFGPKPSTSTGVKRGLDAAADLDNKRYRLTAQMSQVCL